MERLDSLTDQEKRKLRLIEHRRLGGTDFAPGMLYQEAVVQAIVGERHCPRNVPLVAFLAMTMRSLASHRRDALKKQVSPDELEESGNPLTATNQHNPEEALIDNEASEFIAQCKEMMKDDEDAQIAILFIAEGKKGKDLREALGVEQTKLDYIMRRIRKAAARKFPNGWPV